MEREEEDEVVRDEVGLLNRLNAFLSDAVPEAELMPEPAPPAVVAEDAAEADGLPEEELPDDWLPDEPLEEPLEEPPDELLDAPLLVPPPPPPPPLRGPPRRPLS